MVYFKDSIIIMQEALYASRHNRKAVQIYRFKSAPVIMKHLALAYHMSSVCKHDSTAAV